MEQVEVAFSKADHYSLKMKIKLYDNLAFMKNPKKHILKEVEEIFFNINKLFLGKFKKAIKMAEDGFTSDQIKNYFIKMLPEYEGMTLRMQQIICSSMKNSE